MWTGIGVAAGAIGGALISGNSADKAANKQAAATNRAIDETSRQYDTSRQDLAPYRQAGTDALTRLRSLMGLEVGPTTAVMGPIAKDQFDAQAYLSANPDVAQDRMYGTDPYAHYLTYGMKEGRQGYKIGQLTGDASTTANSPLLRKFAQSDLDSDVVYNSGLEFGLDEGRKAIERRSAAGGGYDSGATLKALTRFGNDYGTTKAEGAYGRFVGNQGDVYGRLSGIAGMGSGATNVGVQAGTNTASNLANLYTGQGNAAGAAQIAQGNAYGGALNQVGNYYAQQSILRQLTGGGARTPSSDPAIGAGAD